MSSAALNSHRDTLIALDRPPAPPRAPTTSQPAPISPPPPQTPASADRRGPFRPRALISTRARLHGEMIARGCHLLDAVALAALAWTVFDLTTPAGVWRSPTAAVAPMFAASLLLIWGLGLCRGYGFRASEPLVEHLLKVAAALALAGAIPVVILWCAPASRTAARTLWTWLGAASVLIFGLHLVWWFGVRRLRQAGRLTPTIVIVGANKAAERLIANALQRRDVAILGVFDDRRARAPDHIAGVPVLGNIDDLVGHRIMPYVDRVVIAVGANAQGRIGALVDRLRILPNEITLLMDVKDERGRAAAVSRLADMPLTKVSGARGDQGRALAKRAQDLIVGTLATALAAPVMAIIALAVRLDSPGPILFRQRRQGFNNEDIVVWKFRSMRHDARDERAERQVSHDDDRITAVGRFIRRTSLDELPQLYNVLKGEMSLVGPRPHAPAMKTGSVESSRLVAEYAHRHRMKPGMTGWAAIHGSRGPLLTPHQVRRRVALDIDYIERQSFWLDLYIMLMTLPCLVGDRRAAR